MKKLEQDIIRKLKDGDREAFSLVYDQYADYALRVAYMITRNKEMAADAVQETFIRVFYNIGAFNSDKPFKPWFYRILLNECNRLLSKEKKVIPFDEVKPIISAENNETDSFEYDHLHEALQQLDDINRIPIILKYLHDFSEKEISETLELNINTVKSRLFKGRAKLKLALSFLRKGGNQHE